jgi:hypothetical protein
LEVEPTTLSNAQLLTALQCGSQAAFEILFLRHYERVYGLLFRLLGDKAEAEDVAKKVIVLLTDGANNAGDIEPLAAAQMAKAQGIRVYTIGVARQGPARLPFPDGRVEYRDSEIDEDTLRQIADLTGGCYFRAEDAAELQQIYDRINDLESSP